MNNGMGIRNRVIKVPLRVAIRGYEGFKDTETFHSSLYSVHNYLFVIPLLYQIRRVTRVRS